MVERQFGDFVIASSVVRNLGETPLWHYPRLAEQSQQQPLETKEGAVGAPSSLSLPPIQQSNGLLSRIGARVGHWFGLP